MKLIINHKEEIELLKRESEIPLEDLLKDLPSDYLDHNRSLSPQNVTNKREQNVNVCKHTINIYSQFLIFYFKIKNWGELAFDKRNFVF